MTTLDRRLDLFRGLQDHHYLKVKGFFIEPHKPSGLYKVWNYEKTYFAEMHMRNKYVYYNFVLEVKNG